VGFLAAPHHQSDVGRIISDGFATIKNFSDWILIFSGHLRQGKIGMEIFGCNPNIISQLRVLHISTVSSGSTRNP
jgi:hypothetical protein